MVYRRYVRLTRWGYGAGKQSRDTYSTRYMNIMINLTLLEFLIDVVRSFTMADVISSAPASIP